MQEKDIIDRTHGHPEFRESYIEDVVRFGQEIAQIALKKFRNISISAGLSTDHHHSSNEPFKLFIFLRNNPNPHIHSMTFPSSHPYV